MTDPISTLASAGASTATAAVGTAKAAVSHELAKLKSAATQFEAVFLRQMIGSMRAASDGDGLFDSSATQQFRDMGDAKLAEQMAGKGALHIADMLVKAYGARLAASAKTADAKADAGAATAAANAAGALK